MNKRPIEPYREIRFIRRFISDFNTTCIQAGGHVGRWAAEYARYFKNVATFEPNPDLYAKLRRNLTQCENVGHHRLALGDELDTLGLTVPQGRDKCGYIRDWMPGDYRVEQVPIDELSFGNRVGLIHLDIEGAELPALKGAEKLIQRDRPVIVVEDHTLDHMQYTEEELDGWLNEQGYTLAAVGHYQLVYTP